MFVSKYAESRALIIGINAYKTAPHLSHAVNDAEAVANILQNVYKFPTNNVHVCLETSATRAAILDAYFTFARNGTGSDDRVVVFFAGHGHTERSFRGDVGFLVPWDGDIHNLATLIRWDELTRNADLIEAKHMLFIMDACYGGLALMRAIAPGSKRFLKDMLTRRSRQVLTAGKADEVVADVGGPLHCHSVFTGHLLEALGGKPANPEGIITAASLSAYVYMAVARDAGSQQTPHFGHIHGDGDLIFSDGLLEASVPTVDTSDPLIPPADVLITMPTVTEAEADGLKMITDQVKEYLAEERFRIKLHDLVFEVVRKALSATADDYFPPSGQWSPGEFQKRLNGYESALSDLLKVQTLMGYWGEAYQYPILKLPTARLGQRLKLVSGLRGWLSLRWYPLLLLFYSGGIAAIAAGRYDSLRELMFNPVSDKETRQGDDVRLIQIVADEMNFLIDAFKTLPGHEKQYTPRSEYLLKLLQPTLEEILFLGTGYEASFDRFEVLYALQYAYQRKKQNGNVWGPVGRFGWKRQSVRDVIEEAEKE
ncbi:MAG TPA: caspase family protein, partial [Bryobacteraceae bacterium]|nr:caspase family protein [Bryobacteraceae bacterium]